MRTDYIVDYVSVKGGQASLPFLKAMKALVTVQLTRVVVRTKLPLQHSIRTKIGSQTVRKRSIHV